MKEMTAYAASLTGAKGKALDAETITVGPKRLVKLVEEKPAKPAKQEKPESSKPKSKKDEAQEVLLSPAFMYLRIIANFSIEQVFWSGEERHQKGCRWSF